MRYGYYFLSRTGVKLLSGVSESLPTPSACFRAFPKVSRHRRHVFGHSRKSPDIAGTVSGHPEEQKTKNGAFVSFRFSPFHLFTFSPFHPFTFHLSPLSQGGYLSADSVKRLKREHSEINRYAHGHYLLSRTGVRCRCRKQKEKIRTDSRWPNGCFVHRASW